MSIANIIDNIGKDNLADSVEANQLMAIGEEVKRRFDEDVQSMSTWKDRIDKGFALIDQDYRAKDKPFDGASNFKSTVISEAAIKFGDKASMELLTTKKLVKAEVVGPDPDKSKSQRAERVTRYENYLLNHKTDKWRERQKAMLYRLPLVGNLFKKTYYNAVTGQRCSDVIQFPNFAVNQATKCIDSARSFTHVLTYDRNETFSMRKSGVWLDVAIYPEEMKTENGDEGSNESKAVEHSADNDDRFLEQHCWEDLDGDGYAEPYVITVHEKSMQVVRIVARYSERTIMVKQAHKVETFVDAVNRQAVAHETMGNSPESFEVFYDEMELVRIDAQSEITDYKFHQSLDGTFLGWGYFHEIGNLVKSHNAITNQLQDAGVIANLGGGFLAKGFRKKMGTIRMGPGQWNQTDISSNDLAGGVLPFKQSEPSQVLYSLNEKVEGQLRNYTLVAGGEQQIMANTAPTTALALINEMAEPTNAIMGRVIDSESSEFQKLFRLTQSYGDESEYTEVSEAEGATIYADYSEQGLDIIPTANPAMSNIMQKIQLSEVQLTQFDRVLQAGGNPIALIKDYFEAIGSENLERIFPPEGNLTEQEKQQIAAMTQAQQQANEMQQVQISLLSQQIENGSIEAESLAIKRNAEIKHILAKIDETIANTALRMEQAESEELKNNISTYTASMQALRDSVQANMQLEQKVSGGDFSMLTDQDLEAIING